MPAVHKSKQRRSQCADEEQLLGFCETWLTEPHEYRYLEQFEAPVEQELLVENADIVNALLAMAAPVQLHLANALRKHAAAMEKTLHIVGSFAEQWAETTAKKLRTMRRHASQAILKINKRKPTPEWLRCFIGIYDATAAPAAAAAAAPAAAAASAAAAPVKPPAPLFSPMKTEKYDYGFDELLQAAWRRLKGRKVSKKIHSSTWKVPEGAKNTDPATAVWLDAHEHVCTQYTCGEALRTQSRQVGTSRSAPEEHWTAKDTHGDTLSLREIKRNEAEWLQLWNASTNKQVFQIRNESASIDLDMITWAKNACIKFATALIDKVGLECEKKCS